MADPVPSSAIVYLIGAGPGDPGLLTLRGAELLARCDVVLYDGLSNTELLRHAPTAAELVCVGKHGQQRIWQQDEIIQEMLTHARAGRKVARLKGGDPAVFARTAEEVDALRAAQVPFEIVPGITAALAAGSYAGIPITHRKLASAVALITGHEEPGKPESALDWDALAKFPGTLVVYMGVTTAELWTRSLIDAGKLPSTPAALIRRCSHSDQQVIHCRLDEVAQRLTPASKFRPPVIVILGEVTRLAESMNWFEHKPLFGQTVLVTRPVDQADSLAAPLRDLGAAVLLQPAIEIGPPEDWQPIDQAIDRLDATDTLVFCSRNGVDSFLQRLMQRHDVRQLANTRLAVVGSQTAMALNEFHLRPDMVPPDFRAESLADILATDAHEKQITIVRASRGADVLQERLTAAGADVTQVVAYDHRDVTTVDPKIIAAAQSGTIDWVTVTSSATAVSLHHLFGDTMKTMKIASLSPVTTKTLLSLGYHVQAEADPYTMDALIQSILGSCSSQA
ncbi:MAG: uroporphyrinogen-III C-methyltransferase [Pirellulaceae bacterium]|nr:uroporphyrinogen-III C-methyltransferase [Pirellulaceae bacterium]